MSATSACEVNVEIDISHQTLFTKGLILVRGRVSHGNNQACACVTLPSFFGGRSMTDEEAEDFARPLLVKEFAEGHWYFRGDPGLSFADGIFTVNGKEPANEPILVEV